MDNEIFVPEERTGQTECVEIVGVRFRDGGKVYYFAPGQNAVQAGDPVIVETARGVEYGFAATANEFVPAAKIVPPLRPLIRVATDKDTDRWEANRQLEDEAFEICRQKIEDHRLP
ncbi:MAG: stage 0 sporulation protein, partial [Clostridia bacterium]|nr:stage 0 sporulation protein [Clostridia bacterium]